MLVFRSRFLASMAFLLTTSSSFADRADDWPLYGNGYENHRHSPLTQINTKNVGGLKLAWKYETGIKASFQTSPIVTEGVLFFSTPFNHVIALDGATGKQLWRYKHELSTRKTCCGPANRGVAVGAGKVFQAVIDGHLIALDQATGKPMWNTTIKDVDMQLQDTLTYNDISRSILSSASVSGATGHSFNMAPQFYKGVIYLGSTGAGYGLHLDTDKGLSVVGVGDGKSGLRGFLAAFDAETGKELWRWYSVPGEEWVGQWRETDDNGTTLHRDLGKEKGQLEQYAHTWKLGGGSVWTTPAIDEDTGWLFLGTGNPSPNMDDSTRPGDNLYTSSLVAIDSKTGELKWHFQQVPHDRWGYDVASPPQLIEFKDKSGKIIKAVGQAGKTGWYYVIDRQSGKLLHVSEPFVPQHNMFANPSEEGTLIAPSITGGANWSPSAYDPASQTSYVAGMHKPAYYYRKTLDGGPWQSYTWFEYQPAGHYGTLTAIDTNTGQHRWQHKTREPSLGGALHTAGGLVFSGEGDGEFYALDADTGKKLWSQKTQYGVNAPPISYAINGRQYIAVAAGGNKIAGFKTGDELLVFSLPD